MPELIQSHLPWLGPPWSLGTALLIVALSGVALAFGADWTVKSAVSIADHLRVSTRLLGLTLVAMGTSAPEFAVSVTAATAGNSDMAISNVIGSNIFNLGFILGGIALVRPLTTDRSMVWRDGTILVLSSLAVWLMFGIDLGVERSNGALLLLGLFAYLALLVSGERGSRPAEPREVGATKGWVKPASMLVLSIAVIATAAELFVEAASSIAGSFGVSEWVIGMTIVAAGTSLPEFTTSLVAAMRGHHGLSLGNVIGSDIFNVLGVLGLTAVIHPVSIRPEASGSIVALLVMVLLTVAFLRTGWRLGRREGGFLIALGVLRWILDFS